MIRSNPRNRATILACTAAAAVLAQACAGAGGADTPTGPAGDETGRVSLPLLSVVGDHTYRLNNVYIVIYGPQFAQLFSNDSATETTLDATLQTGSYQAFLQSWRLERADSAGVFQPVDASLVSSSVVSFAIATGTTSTVVYEFRSDGVIVKVGAGFLKVKADVDEIAAVCTPFGADCAEGTWCPPTGLTGMRRSCVSVGSIALGQPCASPFDCVADAACFDLGGDVGSVCAALCPASSFGAACASGGTCQAVDDEYGVCRP